MRIIVLGGAGDMGAETVRDLCRFSKATEIIIADRNRQAAEAVAASTGDQRVKVKTVDATSRDDLIALMKGNPVVAGALGPFYKFERLVVEAALMAGANYVSICDDHDAADSVLALDDLARQRGRRILTGMGWTPGLSNILARKGYEELEEVEEINVYWASSAGDSEGLAVIMHTMHIFTGTVISFQEGRHIAVKAGSEQEIVEFPPPVNQVKMYHLGHPEPLTLPRYLDGLQKVTLKGGLAENYLNGLARFVAALRLSNTSAGKQIMGVILKGLMPIFPKDKKRRVSGIRVDIHGRRGGRPISISYAAIDRMRRLTGIPLSVGTIMMAENRIGRFGVFGPEADSAVQPDVFLEELAKRKVIIGRRELEQAGSTAATD